MRLTRLFSDIRQTGGANVLPPLVFAELQYALRGCAAVILQGGPNWNDRWTGAKKALERWLFVEAARQLGVPVFHLGVSCGPFEWGLPRSLWMNEIIRRALDRHDMLVVRDRFSRPALERLGCRRVRIVESTDSAVFLTAAPNPLFAHVEERIRASRRSRIAVCVRDFQTRYGHSDKSIDVIIDRMAHLLDRVLETADVFFLGTDYSEQPEKLSDLAISELIVKRMKVPGAVIITDEVFDAAALKYYYGIFDGMISMRLHPTILSLSAGVPCVVISYDRKCDDFFGSLGLGDYVFSLATFEPSEVMQRVKSMIGQPALRDEIRSKYANLKQRHSNDWEPMYERIAAVAAAADRSALGMPFGKSRPRSF
jgi:polysaccharide pyruvyl transferase WcaK-like protein